MVNVRGHGWCAGALLYDVCMHGCTGCVRVSVWGECVCVRTVCVCFVCACVCLCVRVC